MTRKQAAAALRRAAKKKGLYNYNRLAEKAGVTPKTVFHVLQGAPVSEEDFEAVSKALDASMSLDPNQPTVQMGKCRGCGQ